MITTRLSLNNRIKTARSIDRHSRWVFPLVFVILTTLIVVF
jgi:cadmium resistance protein CadD (predicted permease)